MKKRIRKKIAVQDAAVAAPKVAVASAPVASHPSLISTDAQMVLDAFQNLTARLGTNTPNLLEGTSYPNTRLTRNYQLLNSLYRSHWIIRKIIDVPQEDMMKNWIDLTTEAEPKYIDKFQKAVRKTRTRAKILQGLKWGRLFGGAAGVMLIAGHENMLDQPLDYDSIMPGSFKGLTVVDRWVGVYPSLELVSDIDSPDFGLPLKYLITASDGKTYDVHSSRVVRFTGRDLPEWESQAENRWGISEIELVFDELKKRDNTSWNIAALIFLANIRVLKMADLGQQLALTNQKAQAKLYDTLSAQNRLMSNMGLMVLDKEDDFDTKQTTFSGLDGVYQTFMLDIAGCAEMPATKIFGRSPSGLNATGESDEQIYEDTLTGRKESHLRPVLDKILPVIAMSTWGMVPDDFDYSFRPSRTLSNKDRADLADKKSKSIVDVFNSGLIKKHTAMKELQQLEDETGMFSNITDEDIEEAKNEPDPIPGEMDFGDPVSERKESPEQEKQRDESTASLLDQAGLLSPLGNIKHAVTDAESGWIGIDLDGTLARYSTWKGNKSIGEPIQPMLDFAQELIAEGENVKIFTARADNPDSVVAIKSWLVKNGLPDLEVTNIKDHGMKALYDDRAFHVKRNAGLVTA